MMLTEATGYAELVLWDGGEFILFSTQLEQPQKTLTQNSFDQNG